MDREITVAELRVIIVAEKKLMVAVIILMNYKLAIQLLLTFGNLD